MYSGLFAGYADSFLSVLNGSGVGGLRREYFGDRARAALLVTWMPLEEGYKRVWGRIRLCTCTASPGNGFTLGVALNFKYVSGIAMFRPSSIRTQPILRTSSINGIVAICMSSPSWRSLCRGAR